MLIAQYFMIEVCFMKKGFAIMFKRPAVLIVCAVIVIIAVAAILFFTLCGKKKNENRFGTEIVFDSAVKPGADTKYVYDSKMLESSLLCENYGLVYYEPVTDDYSVAATLGFDENTFVEDAGMRVYSDAESGAKLKIDRYGQFTYTLGKRAKTGISSNEEYYQYIRDILKESKLLIGFTGEWSSSGNLIQNDNGDSVSITSLTVDTNYCTDGNVTAAVDTNGNVSEIEYRVFRYSKSQKADLISINAAIKRIKAGKAQFIAENTSARLEFENVALRYYPWQTADGDRIMQPVYEFLGTSVLPSGETETFTAIVQANKY